MSEFVPDEILRHVIESTLSNEDLIPSAESAWVDVEEADLVIQLRDGRSLHVDLDPVILDASQEDQCEVRVIANGLGIYWPALNRCLILAEIFVRLKEQVKRDRWIDRRIYQRPDWFPEEQDDLFRFYVPTWKKIINAAKVNVKWGILAAIIMLALPRGISWLATCFGLFAMQFVVYDLIFKNYKKKPPFKLPGGDLRIKNWTKVFLLGSPMIVMGISLTSILLYGLMLGVTQPFLATGSVVSAMEGNPWISLIFIQLGGVAAFASSFAFRWMAAHSIFVGHWIRKN